MIGGLHSIANAFPVFTGRETEPEKVERIYRYLQRQQQELNYMLQNLTQENFNQKALERMNRQQLEAVLQEVKRLLAEGESA